MDDKRKKFSTSPLYYQSTQSTTSFLSTSSAGINWNNASIDTGQNNEILQQLQELNKDVDSSLEFVCGVNDIICTTIPANVFLIALGCFGVVEMGVGIKYRSDCPVESRIPIFLFVGGCFGVLKIIHMVYNNIKMRKQANHVMEREGNGRSQRTEEIVDAVLTIFLLAWQIAGTYWTLSAWRPNWKEPLKQPKNWCSQGLYIFTLVELGLAFCLIVGRVFFQAGLALCYKYTDIFER